MSIAVPDSIEFRRIRAMPRRVLTRADAEAWNQVLTPRLRLRGSRATLIDWQGASLAEIAENGGGILGLPVGSGKTLIAFLLPTMLGATRPLYVVRHSLIDQVWDMFQDAAKDWIAPSRPYRIESRELLQTESAAGFLEDYRPNLIFLDEADELANLEAATPARLNRYRNDHPECIFVPATGTLGRPSVMTYWHLLCWALPGRSPVPMRESEARLWDLALDGRNRGVDPGPLGSTRDSAVAWFRPRLVQTPGVIIVDEDSCKQPITIRQVLAREDAALDKVYRLFLRDDATPGGEVVGDPLSRNRIDSFLGCGLYTVWDPPPPERWRVAYRAKCKAVRAWCAASQRTMRPIETEAQALRRHPDHPVVVEWRAVKPLFRPNSVPVWVTDASLLTCQEWLANLDRPGIVWCGSVDFAERLAERTGLRYYGAGNRSADGIAIHRAPRGVSLIASWQAGLKGLNMQDWPRQLVTMPPQSEKWLEQLFGRGHRRGLNEPMIIDVLVGSGGALDSFEDTIVKAREVRDKTTQTQKILRARIERATPKLTPSNKYRWARQQRKHKSKE